MSKSGYIARQRARRSASVEEATAPAPKKVRAPAKKTVPPAKARRRTPRKKATESK